MVAIHFRIGPTSCIDTQNKASPVAPFIIWRNFATWAVGNTNLICGHFLVITTVLVHLFIAQLLRVKIFVAFYQQPKNKRPILSLGCCSPLTTEPTSLLLWEWAVTCSWKREGRGRRSSRMRATRGGIRTYPWFIGEVPNPKKWIWQLHISSIPTLWFP